MSFHRLSTVVCQVIIGWLLMGFPAHAVELTGAWASSVSACGKMFVKNGSAVSFAKDADLYGSGLIIGKNRISGKMASCNITARKEDGSVTHFVARCSTDIALETVQFSFQLDGKDKITRIYPGMPELNSSYYRCPE